MVVVPGIFRISHREKSLPTIQNNFVGLSVAPVVSAVDKALAENASGKATLWNSFKGTMLEVAFKPATYFRSPTFASADAEIAHAIYKIMTKFVDHN